MKLSEFLTDLENMLQDVMHTASNPYIYGLFLHDIFCYICGENPKYELSDYVDDENCILWEDMQYGRCEFCWVNADKEPYGFQVRDEYAYLPCYDDFVEDLAYQLYGSKNGAVLEKARKRISSLDFMNGKESLDLDVSLMDNQLIETVFLICPDFFEFAGTNEKYVRILICTFFEMLTVCGEEIGCGEWRLLNLESPALNAWLQFLYGDRVSDQDRLNSRQILTRLVDTPVAIENCNDEICLCSHEPQSACFERPQKGDIYIPFSLSVMQNSYGIYNSGYADGFFWFGLVSPGFLSVMVDVQEFLEKMDEKYHFFSNNGHSAGMESAGMQMA